jgi:serine/threonine protein kinase
VRVERIGAYEVVRRLAEGRMGTVWLARSRGGRDVAVRVMRAELAADPAFRERFRAEVAAVRAVGGLHTAPVVDADPDAAAPWLATAFVPGPTLAQLLAVEGTLDEQRLRGLGAALAEALQEIHRAGLVHRDLTPGNIVLAADGPRVLDFSLARALNDPRQQTCVAFGTPGFLAPEQAAGLEPGPAADVFALGAVLVAAAGGSRLGSAQQGADLAALPASLRPVVAACLDHDSARRPGTGQLLDWLSPLTAAPTPAQPAPTPAQPAPAAARPAPAPQPAPAQPPSAPPPPPAPAMPAHPPAAPGLAPSPYAPGAPIPPLGAGAAPEFLAMDRRNAVVLDAEGMSLGSDGAIATFPWPAVDVAWCEKGPGRGNVLAVALALHDGTVHSCEVGTRDPAELAAWIEQFNVALAYYSPEE